MTHQIVDLPSPQALARMASGATQMLFSTPIEFSNASQAALRASDATFGHTCVIPLIGSPAYVISARASEDGGYALATVMFDCNVEAVDDSMVADSLGELVNILAGEVKKVIAPTHTMGLPTRLTDEHMLYHAAQSTVARVYVRTARATIDLAVLVFEAKSLDTPDQVQVGANDRARIPRVLIVDDDSLVRSALRAVLTDAGCFVIGEAENGQQALAVFAMEQPDVVCLDIEMPGVKGTEVLAEIRRRRKDTVVLLISSHVTTQNVLHGVEHQVDGLIGKPFKAATVIAELERAMRGRG